MNVVPIWEVPTRERPTGIHHVATGQRHEHQFAVVENRPDKAPVGQMVALAVEWIIGTEHIARMQVVTEMFQDVLHAKMLGQEHRSRTFGHGDGAALCIPDAGSHVVQLGQQITLCSTVDDVPHFPGNTLKGMPGGG